MPAAGVYTSRRRISKVGGRLLTAKEQDVFISLVRQSLNSHEAVKTAGYGLDSFYRTLKESPEFQKKLDDLRNDIVHNIEQAAFRSAMGECELIEETWVAQREKGSGDPIMGADGKPIMILQSTKIKKLPPSDNLAQFLLKSLAPERYCDKRKLEITTVEYETPDDLRGKLFDRLLELKSKAGTPLSVN